MYIDPNAFLIIRGGPIKECWCVGDGVETVFSILTFATYTNITESIWSTDILEELYHTVLPFSFTVNVCRNGILLAKPQLNSISTQNKS